MGIGALSTLIFFSQNTVVMTTVVIGNPVRNLRLIIDQIFQGLHNLFFDKEVEKVEPGITEVTTEVKEPRGYLQKGNRKQMCDAEPYETEHAYGLVYDYEEEKVAPSFKGPQYQVYLERAAELCDDDPECKYFNLWTDGGITKFREGQCENLKDTINSTLTYEKIPLPPKLGTECEDKGYKKYNWYDFQKNKVPLSAGAGKAKSEWDEYGDCVRVSCINENEYLNGMRKCMAVSEQLTTQEEIALRRSAKDMQDAVDAAQQRHDTESALFKACMSDTRDKNTTWERFVISQDSQIEDCANAAEKLVERDPNYYIDKYLNKGDGVSADSEYNTGGTIAYLYD